jgi:hypothetical protein
MAAQYTEVTLEEMEKFLKRAFRALRPKQGTQNREYFYDLKLSDSVVIRVWSSIQQASGSGAGVGEDAIRVQLMGATTKRPLQKGKAPIVKRTQGWKNSLQNKVEELIETYEENHQYWDGRGQIPAGQAQPQPGAPAEQTRAPGPGPRLPSDKQVEFIGKMMRAKSRNVFEGVLRNYPKLSWPFDPANIRTMSSMEVSRLIDDMKQAVGWTRFAAEGEPDYTYYRPR